MSSVKARIGGREIELPVDVTGNRARVVRGMAGAVQAEGKGSRAPLQPTSRGLGAATGEPRYRSKWEQAYAQHLDLLQKAGEILGWWYEPINFRLLGRRNFYKADFLVQTRTGMQVREVKGYSKNRREGIVKFKSAAELNSWAAFCLVSWDREQGQWIEQWA